MYRYIEYTDIYNIKQIKEKHIKNGKYLSLVWNGEFCELLGCVFVRSAYGLIPYSN